MKKTFLSIIFLLPFLVFLPSYAEDESLESCCNKRKQPRIISVNASAVVSAVPDMVTVSFNIRNENVEVKLAREENEKIAKNVLNAVRSLKIPEANIKMLNLNLVEQSEWDPDKRRNIFKGYVAQRSFRIIIKDSEIDTKQTLSDKVAQLVTAIVENGANQLQSVNYGLVDDNALINSALFAAMSKAKTKATLMLEPLGESLGKVVSVTENSSSNTPFLKNYSRMSMVMAESSPMPEPDSYSQGDIEVSSSVSVIFEVQ
jgi:uncharacterized protein YggE